jgi:serine/threonine protein kinase
MPQETRALIDERRDGRADRSDEGELAPGGPSRFERALPPALAGRYTAVRLLSPGPLFVTLLATRASDGASCVVKHLGRSDAPAEASAMLAREARLLEAIAGHGAPELLERGDGIVVMRDTAMPTLAESVLATGNLRAPGACDVARASRALFAALAALHDASDARGPLHVVHGDVTPANAFLAPDASRALLADLGLASWRDGSPPHDGAFRGSLLHCAPEVARGERPTARADLFALAASLLHVVTGVAPRGHAPDGNAGAAALLAAAAERPVEAYDALPPARRAQLGAHVLDALRACLAFDPAARPARAADLLVLIPLA